MAQLSSFTPLDENPLVVCTVPTYDEVANIRPLVHELLGLGANYHVVVIDDDSPDGTWRAVEEMAREEPRVTLIHRTTQRGRGSAGREGFMRALAMGAEVVIEMDADFSHQPRYIPILIERLRDEHTGLVLGSRGVAGGRDAQRAYFRRALTLAANAYIRLVLGVRVRDCNSGFRAWQRATLERIRVAETFSEGPAIVQELLFKTHRAGIGIAEVPIQFENRAEGESTLTLRTLFTGYTTVLKLRWLALSGALSRPDESCPAPSHGSERS